MLDIFLRVGHCSECEIESNLFSVEATTLENAVGFFAQEAPSSELRSEHELTEIPASEEAEVEVWLTLLKLAVV